MTVTSSSLGQNTHRTLSRISSSSAFGLPTNRCLFFVLQPSIFKNSSNSSTLRLQQDQPLLPSWKTGDPGWYVQLSSSRLLPASYSCPHPFLLHFAPFGMSLLGSSDSDSASGAGAGAGEARGGCTAGVTMGIRGTVTSSTGTGAATAAAQSADGFGWGAGVSSTVLWVPVVHGGMARNSSKVRTRGLQHCQPNKKKKNTHTSVGEGFSRMISWGISACPFGLRERLAVRDDIRRAQPGRRRLCRSPCVRISGPF
jgi:hypothetical protein